MRLVAALLSLLLCENAAAGDALKAAGPGFFGHYELLSSAQREAVLKVARTRVEALMPGAAIISVKVFADGNEVYVTFGRDLAGPAGGLNMHKTNDSWKITSEQKPPKT